MDGISENGGVQTAVDLKLLKESQDLMKQQASALLEAIPKAAPMSPNPPGVGARVNLRA